MGGQLGQLKSNTTLVPAVVVELFASSCKTQGELPSLYVEFYERNLTDKSSRFTAFLDAFLGRFRIRTETYKLLQNNQFLSPHHTQKKNRHSTVPISVRARRQPKRNSQENCTRSYGSVKKTPSVALMFVGEKTSQSSYKKKKIIFSKRRIVTRDGSKTVCSQSIGNRNFSHTVINGIKFDPLIGGIPSYGNFSYNASLAYGPISDALRDSKQIVGHKR